MSRSTENTVIGSVSEPSVGQNLVFLRVLLASTAWGSVCGGSAAQELDSTRFLMAGCREERPKAEQHGLESPCTAFGYFCVSET